MFGSCLIKHLSNMEGLMPYYTVHCKEGLMPYYTVHCFTCIKKVSDLSIGTTIKRTHRKKEFMSK